MVNLLSALVGITRVDRGVSPSVLEAPLAAGVWGGVSSSRVVDAEPEFVAFSLRLRLLGLFGATLPISFNY